jgi:hypothetical protein
MRSTKFNPAVAYLRNAQEAATGISPADFPEARIFTECVRGEIRQTNSKQTSRRGSDAYELAAIFGA